MLNTIYQLVAPRRIDLAVQDMPVAPDALVVRPTHLSICHADQRYYQGMRDAKVLAEKLPMAMIHEAHGQVVFDGSGTYKAGDRVVMVPNLPVEERPFQAENYIRSSRFRSSTADGFMQELVVTSADRAVALPDGIDLDVAAFTELVSVSTHTINRFDAIAHAGRDSIGVWGDGNVGFITALLLRTRFPETKIYVFGKNSEKLADFTFVTATYLITEIPDDLLVDHAFECVGGAGSGDAIEQIIAHIHPEGTVALMGVSENNVPINTRMVLEKGLRLYGSSRSGVADFRSTLDLYAQHPEVPAQLARIVGGVFDIRDTSDIATAFADDRSRRFGKTVLHWLV
ncbi:MAG: alcohol dehydrogenase catalytic domain-containing protein [Eggerthellaceae bacterium]|nr:alcohol dehydrogenase catalytic domain-containing protein [Eggerthellaceae bacterium]